ncbi:unnamed protein product [Acanthosepion pharaonis]|uniref:Reverse transcriptase/retrotransposon-derived protein RNase H-like domain-containing protein n=1 Tax=Acanthosepion pharaonis TaxID=158019 RepID=A0A812CHT4_ACAPH|nr:unnamed protein product [Sepia pharaonis]
MVDSGSTHNFIKLNVVKSLGLPILPSSDTVSMASSNLTSKTQGYCIASIAINGQTYPDMHLSVLPNLCTPVILGQEFMQLHNRVEFLFNGDIPPLQICNTAQMKIEPPALFANLSDDYRLTPLKELPAPNCGKSLKRALGVFSYYSPWVENFSDCISPLLNISSFPIAEELKSQFQAIKDEICKASVAAIEDEIPFTIETDASATALAACLSQNGRSVAYFSRALTQSEQWSVNQQPL